MSIYSVNVCLNKTNISLKKGDKFTLSATVLPANAINKKINWRSTNQSAATVNDGVIIAKSGGETYIYAELQDGSGKHDVCYVNVIEDILVTSITVNPTYKYMNIGDTAYLYEIVCPKDATNKCVGWRSSNSNIVSVNPISGLIYANSLGTATIIATALDGSDKNGTCVITVNSPNNFVDVDIHITNYSMNAGDKLWQY